MSAGSSQDGSAPTLEQLQEAVIHRNAEQLLNLRAQLDWSPKSDELATPACTDDAGLDRLHFMVDSFGPKCLSCKNANGNTLVHLTAKTCKTDAAIELIYKTLGEDQSALYCLTGKDDNTAVHSAAKNRNSAALKWLVLKLGPSCLKLKNGLNNEVVHLVAQHQGAESMELINTELGAAHFEQPGELERTPFHFAALNERSSDALLWLIRKVGSSEALTTKDKQNNTPVHLAAKSQDRSCMELLKEYLGIHIFTLDGEEGQSVVHCAAQNSINNSALAWCVKELGAECLLAMDLQNRTPLHFAAQYQGYQSIEMAVNALGPSCLTIVDSKKRTVVHYAAMNVAGNSALRWIVSKLGPDCLKLREVENRMPIHLVGWHQGIDSLRFVRLCLGPAAFQLTGRNKRIIAHYVAENPRKAELLPWIVKEIGPHCMLVPDTKNVTPAEVAGYLN